MLSKINKKHINVEIVKNKVSFFFIVTFNFNKKIKKTKINIKEFIFLFKGVKKFNNKAIRDMIVIPIKLI